MLLWRICNFSKCFCLVTCYVNCELLGLVDFNAGCSCGGSVGGGRSTRISFPYLVFRGLLVEYRVVWYSPLASTKKIVGC